MKKEIIFGLLLAFFLAIFISPFASPLPDGLEKVAEDKEFIEKGEVEPIFHSPVPDYTWPGIKSKKLATSIAGMGGTIIVFFISFALSYLLKKKT